MGEQTIIGIGEIAAFKGDHTIVSLGIGSCIALAIYDKDQEIGSLAHIMLASSKDYNGNQKEGTNLLKYADEAIPKLIEKMIALGASRTRLHAKMAGGAHMFPTSDSDKMLIGKQNSEAVRQILKESSIPLDSEDVGGNKGRSIYFDILTKKMRVKTIEGINEI